MGFSVYIRAAQENGGAKTIGDMIGQTNVLWIVFGVCALLIVLFAVFAYALGACARRRPQSASLRNHKTSSSTTTVVSGIEERSLVGRSVGEGRGSGWRRNMDGRG